MRLFICLTVLFAVALVAQGEVEEQQKRVLRRVIKSTPTATNLGRVRLVTVRSTAEKGGVAEISSKEAANFGQRSSNETSSPATDTKSKQVPTTQPSVSSSSSAPQNPTTFSSTTTTTTTSAAPTTQSSSATTSTSTETSSTKPEIVKLSERQQSGSSPEVELLSGAPSSWQSMTAVEAPAAMLIAAGTRTASHDLASSGSDIHSSEEYARSTEDFLRSSATKGTASYTQESATAQQQETSRVQQQTRTQQQSYFYPQTSRSKTSGVKGTKTHWYQPPTTTTTPRPAPLIQQEQYEQQKEQYVEQVEYSAAPLGQAEPFAFDFKTLDNNGNGQYRKEESDKNGVVHGSYGYTDANGIYRHVEYVADQNGFRANIKSNEPGLNGDTQPASIRLNDGQASPANNQRLSAPSSENGDWVSNNQESSGSSPADLALAPPNFESAHRSDRIRSPRQYRN